MKPLFKFKTYYFVTIVEDLENSTKEKDIFKANWDSRCWGFFETREEAEKLFKIDWLWHDGQLNYAVIEEMEPGFLSVAKNEVWYKRTKHGVIKKIKKPKKFKNIVNWSIG